MPCRVRLFDCGSVADADPRAGAGLPEPPQDGGGRLMAWGKQLGEELAAQEAARVAQERAAMRARMSPWEEQNLVLLGEIRDALTTIAAAVFIAVDQPGSAIPHADPGQPAGGSDDSTPTGGHPET